MIQAAAAYFEVVFAFIKVIFMTTTNNVYSRTRKPATRVSKPVMPKIKEPGKSKVWRLSHDHLCLMVQDHKTKSLQMEFRKKITEADPDCILYDYAGIMFPADLARCLDEYAEALTGS